MTLNGTYIDELVHIFDIYLITTNPSDEVHEAKLEVGKLISFYVLYLDWWYVTVAMTLSSAYSSPSGRSRTLNNSSRNKSTESRKLATLSRRRSSTSDVSNRWRSWPMKKVREMSSPLLSDMKRESRRLTSSFSMLSKCW